MLPAAGPPSPRGGRRVGTDAIPPAVGCFTHDQLQSWEAHTSDPWVVSTISQGYRIQFRRRPPGFNGVKMTIVGDPAQADILRREIGTLLEKGAIVPVEKTTQEGGFYSIYFLVPKKDGGLRPVLDLRALNRHLKVLRFHMLRTTDVIQGVRQDDWFTTIDLKDAYFHVPIAGPHQQFLRFAFEGQAYQFRVLPFGISLAPRVFTRVVAAALAPLQAKGLRVFPYLDDWLICSRSLPEAHRDLRVLTSHVTMLGLNVNLRKSVLVPRQQAVFLGILIDSQSMLATPSQRRVSDILQLASSFRRGRTLPFVAFLRLLGMLTAASSIVPLGQLLMRPLQIWVNSLHLHPTHHRRTPVRISAGFLRALHPWSRARLTQGVRMHSIPSRREVVTTDASLTGWGAVWQHRSVRGSWSPRQQGWHINMLELTAVLLALRHFLPVLVGRHVLIRTDNTAVVYHINHQGSTRSRRCLRVVQRLLPWALAHMLSLRAMHIPGVRNTAADFLSRRRPHPGEWMLHPEVMRQIWSRYGKASVDLFASQASTQCPLWFSLAEPTSPMGQDALACEWPHMLLYAFPPLPLILPTLDRIANGNHRALLVAPRWPSRPWFPFLISLLDGEPWRLPPRMDLLSQLDGQIWHPHPARLQLWVWPLKGQIHC